MATPVFHNQGNLLFLLGSLYFGGFGRNKSSEFLHQATLAAGGGVLVDHAFASGFIELADGFENKVFGLGSFFRKRCTCLVDSSTGCAAHVTVIDTALFVLLISFDL